VEIKSAIRKINKSNIVNNDISFDPSFRHGYFRALLDANGFFERHSDIIKKYHLNNIKGMTRLLKALLDGRDAMMKFGPYVDFTVVCSKDKPHIIKDLYISHNI
jgi:hypothetical protein